MQASLGSSRSLGPGYGKSGIDNCKLETREKPVLHETHVLCCFFGVGKTWEKLSTSQRSLGAVDIIVLNFNRVKKLKKNPSHSTMSRHLSRSKFKWARTIAIQGVMGPLKTAQDKWVMGLFHAFRWSSLTVFITGNWYSAHFVSSPNTSFFGLAWFSVHYPPTNLILQPQRTEHFRFA